MLFPRYEMAVELKAVGVTHAGSPSRLGQSWMGVELMSTSSSVGSDWQLIITGKAE